MHNVAIIILNWNSTDDTINCINSLGGNYNIIIVDNGSKDTERLPKNVHLIVNTKNCGFAAGNNQGIKYAIEQLNPDYVLLLNSDTITTPNFLDPLISLMKLDPKIAAVQPKLLRINNVRGVASNIIDSAGQVLYKYGSTRDRGIGKLDGSAYSQRKEIFGACAAAILYRVKALQDTGLFDERLFSLFEDVDLSWRLRLKGYKIMYEPNSIVYHKRGVSGKITKDNKIIRRFYGFRNCLIVTLKYCPVKYILFFFPIHLYRFIIALYFKQRYKIKSPFLIFSALKERKYIYENTPNIQ